MKAPNKILISRSGGIGDVLMTTPLVRQLKKKFPKANITYMTWVEPAIEGNKYVDNIISYNPLTIINKRPIQVFKLIRKVRKEKFDVVFICDKSWMWGLFFKLCKIPVRIGFDRNGEGRHNTHNVCYDASKYELDYYLDLLKETYGMYDNDKKIEVHITDEERKIADDTTKYLREKGHTTKIVGMAIGGARNPGHTMLEKRWPLEHYETVAKELSKKYSVILFGDIKDIDISLSLAKYHNIFNFCGLPFRDTVALMEQCDLFISHDSGPLHLSACASVPIIALFGPTPPERFAPINAKVIQSNTCTPCYDMYGNSKKCNNHKCMKDIKPEEVLRVAEEMLK